MTSVLNCHMLSDHTDSREGRIKHEWSKFHCSSGRLQGNTTTQQYLILKGIPIPQPQNIHQSLNLFGVSTPSTQFIIQGPHCKLGFYKTHVVIHVMWSNKKQWVRKTTTSHANIDRRVQTNLGLALWIPNWRDTVLCYPTVPNLLPINWQLDEN